MKRKVILHGPSTLSISLPFTWVKKNNIQKGDYVDLSSNNNVLFITPDNIIKEIQTKAVSVRGLNEQSSLDLIKSLYKKGFDELKIEYENSEFVNILHKYMNMNLLGFEIVKQTKEEIVVRAISEYNYEEFENLFKKLFSITTEYLNKILEIIESGTVEGLNNYLLHQVSINRISNLCQRIVLKDKKQDTLLYSIILSINRIGDVLSDFLQEIKEKDSEITHNIIHKFSELKSLFDSTIELYNNFSIDSYEEILKLAQNTQKSLQRTQNTNNYMFLLNQLNTRIRDILEPLLALKI